MRVRVSVTVLMHMLAVRHAGDVQAPPMQENRPALPTLCALLGKDKVLLTLTHTNAE